MQAEVRSVSGPGIASTSGATLTAQALAEALQRPLVIIDVDSEMTVDDSVTQCKGRTREHLKPRREESGRQQREEDQTIARLGGRGGER